MERNIGVIRHVFVEVGTPLQNTVANLFDIGQRTIEGTLLHVVLEFTHREIGPRVIVFFTP